MKITEKEIALACDHGGYDLKLCIMDLLKEEGYSFRDYGCESGERVDYPVFASKVCSAIQSGKSDIGILICGTGIGMSIAANKHKGIRAACCSDSYSAHMTRSHNNANVLCFGGRVIGPGTAVELVKNFLETEYDGGRHAERIAMIADIENSQK